MKKLPEPVGDRSVPTPEDAHLLLLQTLEQAVDGVVVIDDQNDVVIFNAAAEQLWGYPRSAVLGRNVRMLMPAAKRAQHDAGVHVHRRGGANRIVGSSVEVPIERADGTQGQATMSVSQVKLSGRTLYCAFVRDAAPQHELLARQRLLSTAVDESDIAVIVAGAQGRIVFANAGFQKLFAYSLAELLGQRLAQLIVGPHTDPAALGSLTTPEGTERSSKELLAYTKDGSPLWVSVSTNAVHDAHGLVCNYVSVLTDITQTKLHEVV